MLNTILLPLGKFFDSNIGVLARKALGGLGVGVISYSAVTAAFESAVAYAQSHYNNIASDALQLIGLAGIGEGIGLIVGAITARLAITTMSKLGVIPK